MIQLDEINVVHARPKKGLWDIAHYFPVQETTKNGKTKKRLAPQWAWMRSDFPDFRYELAYGLAVVAMFLFDKHLLPFGIAFNLSIALDAVNRGGSSSAGSTLTWTHTCTGSNLCLLVTSGNTTSRGVATYNSVTVPNAVVLANGSGVAAVDALAGPATGANTVSITDPDGQRNAGMSISFTGVDQTTPTGATATQTISSSGTLSITTTRANSFTVECSGFFFSPAGTFSYSTGQTSFGAEQTQTNLVFGSAYKQFGAAGAQSLSVAFSGGSTTFNHVAVEVLEGTFFFSPGPMPTFHH